MTDATDDKDRTCFIHRPTIYKARNHMGVRARLRGVEKLGASGAQENKRRFLPLEGPHAHRCGADCGLWALLV